MARSLLKPRLLPLAIAAMVALVAVKSAGVVREALAGAASAPPKPSPQDAAATAPAARTPASPTGAAAASPAQGSAVPGEPPVSDAERALLLDLRKRRVELDTREAAIVARESVMIATEKRLAGRVEELGQLQSRLEALDTARQARDEENWRGLTKLYEAMKPRDAAVIFNDLDRPVLLAVLDRMKESKAALILSAMLPERARQITAELAHRRTQANRPGDAAPLVRPLGG